MIQKSLSKRLQNKSRRRCKKTGKKEKGVKSRHPRGVTWDTRLPRSKGERRAKRRGSVGGFQGCGTKQKQPSKKKTYLKKEVGKDGCRKYANWLTGAEKEKVTGKNNWPKPKQGKKKKEWSRSATKFDAEKKKNTWWKRKRRRRRDPFGGCTKSKRRPSNNQKGRKGDQKHLGGIWDPKSKVKQGLETALTMTRKGMLEDRSGGKNQEEKKRGVKRSRKISNHGKPTWKTKTTAITGGGKSRGTKTAWGKSSRFSFDPDLLEKRKKASRKRTFLGEVPELTTKKKVTRNQWLKGLQ